MPIKLYHYTTIASLEQILMNRTIKFNRLDKLNDLNEGKSADRGNLGMYVFATCWTAESKENLTLWSMYSGGMKGVRIGMPSDMLQTYLIESEPEKAFFAEKESRWLVPIGEIHGCNYTVGPIPKKFLVEMNYSDDKRNYVPQVSESYKHINFGEIGICKRKEWSIENEWRYRFWIAPAPPPPINTYLEYQHNYDILTQESFKDRIVNKDAFFLRIKDEAFSQLEVMIGPKQSEKQKGLTKSIVKKLNPDAILFTSSMENEIRK